MLVDRVASSSRFCSIAERVEKNVSGKPSLRLNADDVL